MTDSTVTVINTYPTAYVIDDEGHVIAPGERLTVGASSVRAQHGVLSGRLRLVETVTPAPAATSTAAPANTPAATLPATKE